MSFFTVNHHGCKNSWRIATVLAALLLAAPKLEAESPGAALRHRAQQEVDKHEKELAKENADLRKQAETTKQELARQREENAQPKTDPAAEQRAQKLEKENAAIQRKAAEAEAEKQSLEEQLAKEKRKAEQAEAEKQLLDAKLEQAERSRTASLSPAKTEPQNLSGINVVVSPVNGSGVSSGAGGSSSNISTLAQNVADLQVRLRPNSIKIIVRELVILSDASTSTLSIDIENISGERLGLGIDESMFLIGSCQPYSDGYGTKGLPSFQFRRYDGHGSVDTSLYRWINSGEKLLLSTVSSLNSPSCSTIMSSTNAEVSIMLIVSDGRQTIKFPLTFQANVTFSQKYGPSRY